MLFFLVKKCTSKFVFVFLLPRQAYTVIFLKPHCNCYFLISIGAWLRPGIWVSWKLARWVVVVPGGLHNHSAPQPLGGCLPPHSGPDTVFDSPALTHPGNSSGRIYLWSAFAVLGGGGGGVNHLGGWGDMTGWQQGDNFIGTWPTPHTHTTLPARHTPSLANLEFFLSLFPHLNCRRSATTSTAQ